MSDMEHTTVAATRSWGRRCFVGLAALNAVLAGALVFNWSGTSPATAQVQNRLPSEYVMIPGEVAGSPQAIIYVIDTTNDLLSAFTFDSAGQTVRSMRPLDLTRAFTSQPNTRSR